MLVNHSAMCMSPFYISHMSRCFPDGGTIDFFKKQKKTNSFASDASSLKSVLRLKSNSVIQTTHKAGRVAVQM